MLITFHFLFFLQVWFFEHVFIAKNRKFTGQIPRFFDHKLNVYWRRSSFTNVMKNVLPADIREGALQKRDGEVLIQSKGFVASDYFSYLTNNAALHNPINRNIVNLLERMTPVYCLFNFNVSNDLIRMAPKLRFDELKYVHHKTGVAVLSPASEQKFIAEVSHSERQYHITKKLFCTRKYSSII
jgi:hypothetical protein